MLDPLLWQSLFTVIYNRGTRPVFDLRRQMTNRLIRIDITTSQKLKATWNKGGDLIRLADRAQVGRPKYIPWGSSYQIWPADGFYPYELQWRPVPWFPIGKIQFFEYTGPVSHADLVQIAQAIGDTDTLLALTLETMNIIDPAGSKTTSSFKTEFKQDVATAAEVLAANGSRNGGTILNKGTKKLYLNFGGVADKGSHLIVSPGGNIDLQANYVGPVSAIWDGTDATPGNSSKAVFIEFLA